MKETIRQFKETVEIRSSVFNRLRSHRYFPMALLFGVLLSAACVHVWQRVRVVELVKEVSQLKKENTRLLDIKNKVHSEIAALSTASRIERCAADTLGLVRVKADRLFTLVPRNQSYEQPDELELMLYAINRVAQAVPAITESSASARGVNELKLDTAAIDGTDR
jgi:cell division protein FtsL